MKLKLPKNNILMRLISKYKNQFLSETWALPVDAFRILAGLLCLYYFITIFLEVEDFSNPNGLLNHELFIEAFWFYKINLIQPSFATTKLFYGLSLIGCIGSVLITVGYRARLSAAILYLIAVCTQRWNFGVMFVDDSIMHLLLFWMIILPIGKTLNLTRWLKQGNSAFDEWLLYKVPGATVRCFLINVLWIYFFAGTTKLLSPLWREGFAMYPILLLPISHMPDFWKPEYLPAFKYATYTALGMEIIIPFLLITRKGSATKYFGLFLQILFNLGIILTLKIPFANIALIASSVLFFREEIMETVLKWKNIEGYKFEVVRFNLASRFALIFVILIILSTSRGLPLISDNIPALDNLNWRVTRLFWVIGIGQNYYLFNWIDRLNYHVDTKATFNPSGSLTRALDLGEILPYKVRNTLLMMRYHDINWMFKFDPDHLRRYKEDLNKRMAGKICTKIGEDGTVDIRRYLHHITPENYDLKDRPRIYRTKFECINKKATNIRVFEFVR